MHGSTSSPAISADRAAFFKEVSELHAFCVLNYLAVLKIVKKHDKHSQKPMAQQVIEHIFSQAFYLSLEHSYLYSACRDFFMDHPLPPSSLSSSTGKRPFPQQQYEKAAAFGRHNHGDTLEVSAHFERCLMGDHLSVGCAHTPIDFAALRRADTADSGSRITMQIECLLALAGAGAPSHARVPSRTAAFDVPLPRPSLHSPHSPMSERGISARRQEWSLGPGSGSSASAYSTSAPSMPMPCTSPTASYSVPEGMEEAGSDWAATLFVASRTAHGADQPTSPVGPADTRAFKPLGVCMDVAASSAPTGAAAHLSVRCPASDRGKTLSTGLACGLGVGSLSGRSSAASADTVALPLQGSASDAASDAESSTTVRTVRCSGAPAIETPPPLETPAAAAGGAAAPGAVQAASIARICDDEGIFELE